MRKVHSLQLKEIRDWNLLSGIFIKVSDGQDIYKSIEYKYQKQLFHLRGRTVKFYELRKMSNFGNNCCLQNFRMV